MELQRRLNKRFIVSIVLLIIVVTSYDFIIQNLRWTNKLYLKKTGIIKSLIVDKNTRETSEGVQDDYYLEFMLDSSKTIKDSVTIWRDKTKLYNIGDSMKIIVSIGYPIDIEAFENLDRLRLNIIFSIILIIIGLYSIFEVVRLSVKKPGKEFPHH